uniref:Uncharacterized protein n=1 Tax=Pyxicephalus adspersus TaxID=30357 RepID=A0AAV3B9S6_PYXAD|nr:TPA: hypothetical protein GDO54_000677 [Pyxicephalus adspersus]
MKMYNYRGQTAGHICLECDRKLHFDAGYQGTPLTDLSAWCHHFEDSSADRKSQTGSGAAGCPLIGRNGPHQDKSTK